MFFEVSAAADDKDFRLLFLVTAPRGLSERRSVRRGEKQPFASSAGVGAGRGVSLQRVHCCWLAPAVAVPVLASQLVDRTRS